MKIIIFYLIYLYYHDRIKFSHNIDKNLLDDQAISAIAYLDIAVFRVMRYADFLPCSLSVLR